jgi:hypothetical protein
MGSKKEEILDLVSSIINQCEITEREFPRESRLFIIINDLEILKDLIQWGMED